MNSKKTNKRQERREKAQRQNQRQRLTLIGVMLVVATVLIIFVAGSQKKAVETIVTVEPPSLPSHDGLSMGDAKAPAAIEAFEDFQCPACQYFTKSIEPLIIQNLVTTGKARYIFHQYPFIDGSGASNGGESDQASNASMCANEQGKFWDMHATLYANWNGENQGGFSNKRLQAMAEKIGLDMTAFNSCFDKNKYKADIQADFDKGIQMGVSGTPTVFVNGAHVGQPGKIATYEEIVQAVENIVNAAK